MIAEKWGISREEMEQFALTSHERAFAAIRAGHFDNEIFPVDGFALDEGPRESSLEKMAGLVRMLGEPRNTDPSTVEIGMPVRAMYIDFPASDVGPAWTNYAWEPAK